MKRKGTSLLYSGNLTLVASHCLLLIYLILIDQFMLISAFYLITSSLAIGSAALVNSICFGRISSNCSKTMSYQLYLIF